MKSKNGKSFLLNDAAFFRDPLFGKPGNGTLDTGVQTVKFLLNSVTAGTKSLVSTPHLGLTDLHGKGLLFFLSSFCCSVFIFCLKALKPANFRLFYVFTPFVCYLMLLNLKKSNAFKKIQLWQYYPEQPEILKFLPNIQVSLDTKSSGYTYKEAVAQAFHSVQKYY